MPDDSAVKPSPIIGKLEIENKMPGTDPAIAALLSGQSGGGSQAAMMAALSSAQNNNNPMNTLLPLIALRYLMPDNQNQNAQATQAAVATASANDTRFEALAQQINSNGSTLSNLSSTIADAERTASLTNTVDNRFSDLGTALATQHAAQTNAFTAQFEMGQTNMNNMFSQTNQNMNAQLEQTNQNLNNNFARTMSDINNIQRDQATIARDLAECCCETKMAIKDTQTQIVMSENRMVTEMNALDRAAETRLREHEASDAARHTQVVLMFKDTEIQNLRDRNLDQSQNSQTSQIVAQLNNMQMSQQNGFQLLASALSNLGNDRGRS